MSRQHPSACSKQGHSHRFR